MKDSRADCRVHRRCRAGWHAWLVCSAGVAASSALARERAQKNVVTAAEDAFGVIIGRETLGPYSTSNVLPGRRRQSPHRRPDISPDQLTIAAPRGVELSRYTRS